MQRNQAGAFNVNLALPFGCQVFENLPRNRLGLWLPPIAMCSHVLNTGSVRPFKGLAGALMHIFWRPMRSVGHHGVNGTQ